MEIADVEAALGKVRQFIAVLEQDRVYLDSVHSSTKSPVSPQLKQTNDQVQEQFPLIVQIAARADADLAAKLRNDDSSYGWPSDHILVAARQLAGLLSSVEESERILGPVGPPPATTSAGATSDRAQRRPGVNIRNPWRTIKDPSATPSQVGQSPATRRTSVC